MLSARVLPIWCLVFIVCASTKAERLPVKLYTSADGLGSSFVSDMMRDSRGFLWFATRDGLSRFDGQRFVTYQIGVKDAPPGIEQILEARDGTYWITTTGGLYRFTPQGEFNLEQPVDDVGGRTTLNAQYVGPDRGYLYQDREGSLWVGLNKIIVSTDGGKPALRPVELNLPAQANRELSVLDIDEAVDGSYWFCTSWGLVRSLPDGQIILYDLTTSWSDAITSLTEDESGRIWMTRTSGVYIFKPETLEELSQAGSLTIHDLDGLAQVQPAQMGDVSLPEKPGEIFKFGAENGFPKGSVTSVYRTSDNHLWITTYRSLIEFDGLRFRPYFGAQSLTASTMETVEDANGNLWLSGSGGATRLDRRGLITFNQDDGLSTNAISSIYNNSSGELFAISDPGVISRYVGENGSKNFETVHLQVAPDAKTAWHSNGSFLDSAGAWWVLTTENLYRFPAGEFSSLAAARPINEWTSINGMPVNSFYRMYEDSRGDVWFSTHAADASGLIRWDRAAETFHSFSASENYPPGKAASAFAEDAQGNLWIGFYEGGLARFSAGRFTDFSGAENVPPGLVTALFSDKDKHIWMATSLGGLSRLEDSAADVPTFARYTTANGLSSNNARSITADDFGQIYVGTARGVDRLTPETGRIRNYSTNDGLAGDFVFSAFRDRSGTLWFGTANGVSRLVAEKEEQMSSPQVWLSALRIAGESQNTNELGSRAIENLELAPNQNNFQIDFFSIDFSPNESLRYQYMLEGADTDWSTPSEQRTVNFSNLSPGNYRFLVRSVNADGVSSEKPAMVSFKLLPPIWRRWWFITLGILFVGAGVFALDRFRVRKTRQVESALGKSKESETRFRTLAETASDAIITIDTESRIVFVNEAVEQVFGYKAEELIGEKLTILMPESFRPRHDAGLKRYVSTNRKNISWSGAELQGRHKSGAEIPLELSFGEFDLNGERYFTGVARDISERKRAEDSLRKSREERFRELERVRTRIATDLHDDIGSSLTQIAVLSEVLRSQSTANIEENNTQLQKISTVSVELMQSMGDIVWAINPRNDNLPNLIKRMRRFASDVFSAIGVHFDFATPETEANAALGANIRREVFAIYKECVNNMARHSECQNAKISLEIENRSLRLLFEDDGRGFDALEKLSESFAPEIGGNGLINIRRRAQELGGVCEINSEIGRGTTIKIEIPLFSSEGEIQTSQAAGENVGNRI